MAIFSALWKTHQWCATTLCEAGINSEKPWRPRRRHNTYLLPYPKISDRAGSTEGKRTNRVYPNMSILVLAKMLVRNTCKMLWGHMENTSLFVDIRALCDVHENQKKCIHNQSYLETDRILQSLNLYMHKWSYHGRVGIFFGTYV